MSEAGTIAETDGVWVLKECPNCDYSLVGLPVTGQCPECGETYGQAVMVLNGRGRGKRSAMPVVLALALASLPILVGAGVILLLMRAHASGGVRLASFILSFLFIALGVFTLATTLVAFVANRHADSQVRFSAYGCSQIDRRTCPTSSSRRLPDGGLSGRLKAHEAALLPWVRVGRVRASSDAGGRCHLRCEATLDDYKPREIDFEFVGAETDAAELVRRIEWLKSRINCDCPARQGHFA